MTPDCQLAVERWRDIARWRNLWTILLFIIGAAIVILFALSILLFIRETWVVGGFTTVGIIVSGTAIKWVVSRRNEAVKEEGDAFGKVENNCKAPQPVAAKGVAAPAPVLLPAVQQQIDELKKRLRIFGSIR